MTTFYLLRTKDGVMEKIDGKMRRIHTNCKYILPKHEGSFMVEKSNGELSIIKYDKHNKVRYVKRMDQMGMYVCNKFFAKLSIKTNAHVRELHYYLSSMLGKTNYILSDTPHSNFNIYLNSWIDGTVRYKYMIEVDVNSLDVYTMNSIKERIEQLDSIDIEGFLMHYMQNTDETTFTISNEFIDIASVMAPKKVVSIAR